MEKAEILKRLAPCGLHCGKCFAYRGGEIGQNSKQLKQALGNFDAYADRFVDLLNEPVFSKYTDFKELLSYLSDPQCRGCRSDACKLFTACKVKDCAPAKNVDFCFECVEFPCNKTGFDKHLHERSVAINRRIEEIGMEQYYKEIKDKSRY